MLSDSADCQNHLLMDQKYLFFLCAVCSLLFFLLSFFPFHCAPLLLCLFISSLFSLLFSLLCSHIYTQTLYLLPLIYFSLSSSAFWSSINWHTNTQTGIDLKWFWHRNRWIERARAKEDQVWIFNKSHNFPTKESINHNVYRHKQALMCFSFFFCLFSGCVFCSELLFVCCFFLLVISLFPLSSSSNKSVFQTGFTR